MAVIDTKFPLFKPCIFCFLDSAFGAHVERGAQRSGGGGRERVSHGVRRRGLRVPFQHRSLLSRSHRSRGRRRHALVLPLRRLSGA